MKDKHTDSTVLSLFINSISFLLMSPQCPQMFFKGSCTALWLPDSSSPSLHFYEYAEHHPHHNSNRQLLDLPFSAGTKSFRQRPQAEGCLYIKYSGTSLAMRQLVGISLAHHSCIPKVGSLPVYVLSLQSPTELGVSGSRSKFPGYEGQGSCFVLLLHSVSVFSFPDLMVRLIRIDTVIFCPER